MPNNIGEPTVEEVYQKLIKDDSFGKSLSFDGSSTYVQVIDAASNRLDLNNKFSVAFWFKLDSYNQNALPRFFEKLSDYMCVMGDSNNSKFGHIGMELAASADNGNGNNGVSEFWGNTKLGLGAWYHVVATFDGSLPSNQAQFYLNGIAETMTDIFAWSGVLATTVGNDLFLGRSHGDLSRVMKGKLDQFILAPGVVWTQAQAVNLYQYNTIPPNSLVLGFDDDKGQTADSSGSGNIAVITAATRSGDIPPFLSKNDSLYLKQLKLRQDLGLAK